MNFLPTRRQAGPTRKIYFKTPALQVEDAGPTQTLVFLFLLPPEPSLELESNPFYFGWLPPSWRGGGCFVHRSLLCPPPSQTLTSWQPLPPHPVDHVTSRKALGSGRGSPCGAWEGEAVALRMQRPDVTLRGPQ